MPETFSLEEAYGGAAAKPAGTSYPDSYRYYSPARLAAADAEGKTVTANGANDQSSEANSAASQAASRQELLTEMARPDMQADPKRLALLQAELDKGGKGAAPASQTFSLEDAYGVKAEQKPAETKAATGKQEPRSDLDIALGGIAAGGKAIIAPFMPKNLGNEAVAIGDLVLSVPSMLAGAAADTTVRLGAVLRGVPHKEASALAAQARQDAGDNPLISPNPLSKALAVFGLQPTESGVGSLMSKLSDAIGKGGEYVDKKTGGVLNKDDIESLANMLMATTGAKGELATLKAKPLGQAGGLDMKVPPAERVDPSVDSPPPPTEAAPVPPPKDSPHARAKEDIERTMNIVDPKEANRVRKVRRAQARAAFKDDQAYADYLSKHADEEAGIQARTPSEETKASTPGDSLQEAKGPAEGEATQTKPQGEKVDAGRVDQDLLKVMAIGGAGAALAYAYPDQTGDMAKAAFVGGLVLHGDISKLPDNATFAAVLEKSGSTLKTLERLPQGRSEVTVQSVHETLRRDDVSKSEKEILSSVLDAHQGETISAKDLVIGFKKATGNFELKEKESSEYADYGLGNIDRPESGEYFRTDENGDGDQAHPLGAKTSIWQLPAEMRGSANNHFGDPLYFAHTRSFEEGGIKHVVEIQSDVAQHAKVLSEEEKAGTREAIDAVNERLKSLDAEAGSLRQELRAMRTRNAEPMMITPIREKYNQLVREIGQLTIYEREQSAKLSGSDQAAKVQPMLKNWDRRLVREELAAAARQAEGYAKADIWRAEESLKRMSPDLAEHSGVWKERIDQARQRMNASQRVRFATADTVAKVEGWPEAGEREADAAQYYRQGTPEWEDYIARSRAAQAPGTRFSPEHQGIYDRYKKDTEKFLRGLGGQPYTDPHGHTWIEVPTKPGAAGRRAEMFGGADLKTLSGIAAAGLGMAFGSYLDPKNPLEGAIYGLLGGAALGSGGVLKAAKGLKELAKASKGERITGLTERHEYRLKQAARSAWQASNTIFQLAPHKADRVAAMDAIKKNGVAALPQGTIRRTAEWFQNYRVRLEAAVNDPKTLAAAQDSFDRMSQNTTDISEAVGQFGNAIGRAVANQTFMEELRTAQVTQGATAASRLVQSSKKAPVDYVSIDNPQFANLRVHPDIAPSLRFMFENQQPGALMAGVSMVNTAIKRTGVSFSLFHVKSLFDAGLGAFSHPLIATKTLAQASLPKIFGINRFLEQMRNGGVGDLVDGAARDGLIYSFEREVSASEDVGGNFYKGMQSIQAALDKTLPWTKGNKGALASAAAGGALGYAMNPDDPIRGALTGAALAGGGGTIRALQRMNHVMDNLMWGRVHAAFKLEIYAAKREALMQNTAKSNHPLTSEKAGKIAASYANYIFGGLNWQRMAENINSKFGRDIALGAFSPGGRRWLQLAAFAPDWTISTTMALAKVVGKGDGVKGIFSAKTAADLHRQQLVRSALYYFTVGNAVNYAYSGHYLWDNKDWTRIELGDGRTMQLSKHFTEPFHWILNPGQQAMNKLGFIPREAATQALHVEYLSAKGRMPPMKESRLGHVAKTLNPIAAQQFRDGGVAAGLSGAVGVPIYGQTETQRRDAKMKMALDKYKKAMGIDQ